MSCGECITVYDITLQWLSVTPELACCPLANIGQWVPVYSCYQQSGNGLRARVRVLQLSYTTYTIILAKLQHFQDSNFMCDLLYNMKGESARISPLLLYFDLCRNELMCYEVILMWRRLIMKMNLWKKAAMNEQGWKFSRLCLIVSLICQHICSPQHTVGSESRNFSYGR